MSSYFTKVSINRERITNGTTSCLAVRHTETRRLHLLLCLLRHRPLHCSIQSKRKTLSLYCHLRALCSGLSLNVYSPSLPANICLCCRPVIISVCGLFFTLLSQNGWSHWAIGLLFNPRGVEKGPSVSSQCLICICIDPTANICIYSPYCQYLYL